ncbi:MAG: MBOAT family protein [Treponema sp.]|nr:MBOAT family protein [Treponema sp.]
MSFISLTFAAFFIVFIALYHVAARLGKNAAPIQQALLLMASLVFYAFADLSFLPFLLYIIAVSYIAGRCPGNRPLFVLFIVAELLPLLFFKYSPHGWRGSLIFPLGLSFFTFQGISYVADCHTRKITAERNIIPVALFISFFPVISSGPIQRADKLIPQLKSPHRFDYDDATGGMKLFAWGMFKKLCVADRIAVYVNAVYGDAGNSHGLALLLASVLYSFQIYCDFSGYSDMATGVARYMGFDVGRNFDHPYLSQSVGEFWRRWHISLSSWLRDYVYIPLGGSRVALPRIYLNLMVTFLVSGLWHGAGWHFVAWGMLHGFYLCMGRLLKPRLEKMNVSPAFRIAVSFCLISFAWIFFRAENLGQALLVCRKLADIPVEAVQFPGLCSLYGFREALRSSFCFSCYDKHGGFWDVLRLLCFLILFCAVSISTRKTSGLEIIRKKTLPVRFVLYGVICSLVLYDAPSLVNSNTDFLYFAF